MRTCMLHAFQNGVVLFLNEISDLRSRVSRVGKQVVQPRLSFILWRGASCPDDPNDWINQRRLSLSPGWSRKLLTSVANWAAFCEKKPCPESGYRCSCALA